MVKRLICLVCAPQIPRVQSLRPSPVLSPIATQIIFPSRPAPPGLAPFLPLVAVLLPGLGGYREALTTG